MQPGDSLGPYRIVDKIGAGGMGEVYRGRDARLDRDVAIKVLPAELAGDAERLARFEREARVLAQLDHPNIASVFGLDRQDGITFLVMQLVPGQTLAARLSGGPLSADDAVAIARQVAEGMETAHERGIVHRDLKPANIMVDAEGAVKVLDFGLAKALAGDREAGRSGDLSASPTLLAGTAAGVILGTAAYMSPEQARGRPVDRRADIWAFGCVLYEMLAGRQPFGGDTVTDVLASIVKEEPDWAALPASTPPWLRAVLGRCLDKEPRRRLRDIGEARLALETGGETFAPGAADEVPEAAAPTSRSSRVVAATMVLMAVTAVATWVLGRPTDVLPPLTRTTIDVADGSVLYLTGDTAGPPTLSPDGMSIAFAASTPERGTQLWLRDVDELVPRPLAGTEAAHFPFWSPDGRSIAFFADGRLRRIDLATGQVLTLADQVEIGRGGAWHPDGIIYFVPNTETGIWSVDAGGGEPRPVIMPDPELHTTYRWPQLLPDGEHLIFFAGHHTTTSAATNGTWMVRRDGSGLRQLITSTSQARYASGHLLFVREGSLMAQPFDPDSLQLSGTAVALPESVAVDDTTWYAVFTAAGVGALAYLPAGGSTGEVLRTLDRSGRELDNWGPTGNYQTARFSPDDRRLAVEFQERPSSDLFIYDTEGHRERMSFSDADSASPVWSDDGETLFHATGRDSAVAAMSSRGGSPYPVFELEGQDVWPLDYSAAAGGLLVGVGDYYQIYTTQSRFWFLPADGSTPYAIDTEGIWAVFDGDISPDGRSLAYVARVREGIAAEVFVAPLLRGDGGLRPGEPRRQISSGGGTSPRWRGDGAELYFVRGAGQVTSVLLTRSADGAVTQAGQPQQLFSVNIIPGSGNGMGYDVTSDGQRFVVLESDPRSSRGFVLVSDWRRGLPELR